MMTAMTLLRRLGVVVLVLALGACNSPEAKEAKYLAHAKELYQTGDDAKAMVELRNVLRLNPKNAEALYTVGLIHERGNRMPQAYAAYQAATAEKPDLLPAQAKLGALALMGGEVDVAEKAADAIEKLQPDNPDGLAIRGAVMLRQGDLERAAEQARTALAKDPTPRERNRCDGGRAAGATGGPTRPWPSSTRAWARCRKALRCACSSWFCSSKRATPRA